MTGHHRVAVLDIDGVVADVRHRLHLVSPTTWREFFAAAVDDTLLEPGAVVAHRLARRYSIAWMTGRPERTRQQTAAWLRGHGLPEGRLFMHPERSEDARTSRVIKREHVAALRSSGARPVVAVDDDPRVVDELRGEGLHCLLATWSPYSPTYQDVGPQQAPPRSGS